jgi:hypothetical protein
MLSQYISLHELNVRGASVSAALEVRALAMLLLPIAGNYKYGVGYPPTTKYSCQVT